MKRINLFNSIKRFREGFVNACEEKGIELNLLRTRYTIVHLKDGEDAKFVFENEIIDVKNSLNFMQLRGSESFIPTLLAVYCEKKGMYLNDPVNTEHTQEGLRKMMQMLMLHMDNLPIPESIIVSSFGYEKNKEYILENMSFPLVLKGKGDRGDAVWKINNLEELESHFLLSEEEKKEAIAARKFDVYLLQEYIPNTHDFRVTMFEGKVLGVIKRSSKDGFYNNYCKGADWEYSEITQEEEVLCRKASEAVRVDLSGVDFVRTENGIKFFEANKSPMINKDYPAVIVGMLEEKYLK